MSLEQVYDEVLVPALAQAQLDRHRQKLDEGRHALVLQGIREITETLAEQQRDEDSAEATAQTVRDAKGGTSGSPPSGNGKPRRTLPADTTIDVLCLPAKSEADEIAGLMLARLLEPRGYRVTMSGTSALTSEMVELASPANAAAVVLSALPPKAALSVRYVLKRITARHAGRGVIVGLWKNTRDLTKAGLGDFPRLRVVTTLSEAQNQLDELAPVLATMPAVDASGR
jgi:methylmalonyl-CoA mutase cobalamin-binding subunit